MGCFLVTCMPPATAAQAPLRWAPPVLSNPQTVAVPNGFTHLNLSTSRDYILTLPAGGKTGALWIDGGHNVVLIGGQITIPSTADQTDNGVDNTDTAIYVKGATGTVHIEGVLIHGETDVMFDGIDINAPEATVQIENVRMTGVWGSDRTEHADAIQTWGGVKDLRVDHLSADGDYQGLTIAPDTGPTESAEIENVDLTVDPTPPELASVTTGGGHMIWMTTGDQTCSSYPITLSSVYIADNRSGLPRSNTVWPEAGGSLACAGVLSGAHVTWPSLPVTGGVTLGAPPDGQFVPAGAVGIGYTSPGYAQAPALPPGASPPTISGPAEAGQSMTVSHGAWIHNPTTYEDNWESCDASGSNCSPISGAGGQAYAVRTADVGRTIRVLETASNSQGTGGPVASPTTPAINAPPPPAALSPPANTGAPSVQGLTRAGQTLTASTGGWSGSAPLRYRLQWQRCVASCKAIAGATGSTYRLSNADVSTHVRVLVTVSNLVGTTTAASPVVGPVATTLGQIHSALTRMLTASHPTVSWLLAHSAFAMRFDSPAAGHLVVRWKISTRSRRMLMAEAAVHVNRGPTMIAVRLTALAHGWLRHLSRHRVLATSTFTSVGTRAASLARAVVLRTS